MSGSTLTPSLDAYVQRLKVLLACVSRGQRRVLLEVMDNAEKHLDADAILERAQRIDPRVHRVTVYRTLEMLKHRGLLDELDLLHILFWPLALLRKSRRARSHSCCLPALRQGRGEVESVNSTSS